MRNLFHNYALKTTPDVMKSVVLKRNFNSCSSKAKKTTKLNEINDLFVTNS